MMTYGVELTPCWPCCWYGGAFWNGRRTSNATCHYFRTRGEAQAAADRMRERDNRNTSAAVADGLTGLLAAP